MKKEKIVTVCLDENTSERLKNMADVLSKSKSHIVRDAINFYFTYVAHIDYETEEYKKALLKAQLDKLVLRNRDKQ